MNPINSRNIGWTCLVIYFLSLKMASSYLFISHSLVISIEHHNQITLACHTHFKHRQMCNISA